MSHVSRRRLLVGTATLIGAALSPLRALAQSADPRSLYGAVTGEPFPVRAIDLRRIRPEFLRTLVSYDGTEPAGTIVIDPAQHFLFLVNGDGTAIRYGVGVGRQGFLWSGNAQINAKRVWPDWYPPKEMLERDPSIMKVMSTLQSGIGMAGGPGNPLGARAMYLYQGNKDTLYRIHGTVEPWTIGSSVSSGCIRMINQDVMDLFERVQVGTKVVVLGNAQPSVADARKRYPASQGSAVPADADPAGQLQPAAQYQAQAAPPAQPAVRTPRAQTARHVMYPDQDPSFFGRTGPEYDPYAGQY